ncbi:MAG: response regulator [Anaerolineales bacterium]|nr:MAG: response regulator [Anaerolineales bacterium]
MATDNRILVADGTRGVDFLLQDMLSEEQTTCTVDVVQGGREALEQLRQQGYDMVIANMRRLDPTGLELVQKVRSINRTTRVMLMTAYDYEEVGVEGKRRFIVYDHLTKPLQRGESVKSANQIYGKMAISQKGILILSDERLAAITQQLANLRGDIEAQSIILANIVGDLITSVGPIKGMDLDSFIPVLAIGLAASSEMRNYFNEKELGFNLNYHEGERYAVYSANVGSELLLAILYDHTVRKSKVGTVWYYSKRAIEDLLNALTPPEPIGGELLAQIEEEISEKEGLDLFNAAMRAKPQVSRPELMPVGLREEGDSFSLEEAIAQGLISPDLLRGMDEAAKQEPSSSEVDEEIGIPALEPEPEAEPLIGRETEVPTEKPEAEPAAIAETTDEEEQTDSLFTGFGLQEAIARGLIDPALLGLGGAETEDEPSEKEN